MNQPQSLSELVELAAQYRDTSGLGLSQLAAKNGYQLTATTINQIRQGLYKSKPREGTLRALAWLAGVSDEVAFTAAGQTVPGPPFAEELPPGVDNLSPKARKVVLDMVRVLVDLEKSADASNTDAQEQPADIRDASKRRDARAGQKTRRGLSAVPSNPDAPVDGNIPLPDNWQELAAYTGPSGHKDRESEWAKRGEESQDSDDES
ncbi:helix-turn-helix domain-containing protein [Paenarthrobacter sp. TA1.8]|uniref:helix-turn-helix domain-containing protein n=1 Tax=Paenarthrobacter sp. TA1.8 TaxID=3400219 RepID=UPI003B430F1E